MIYIYIRKGTGKSVKIPKGLSENAMGKRTRRSQEPVIAELVFNLTSKSYRILKRRLIKSPTKDN